MLVVSPTLPPEFISRVTQLLVPRVETVDDREMLLTEAYYLTEPRLYQQIKREGTPRGFAVQLAKVTLDFGCLADSTHCLIPLFTTLRYYVGQQDQREIDLLIPMVNALCRDTVSPTSAPPSVTRPAPATPLQTVSTPASQRTPTVFISYSHADKVFAERLIVDLQHAGHACWIDTVKIKGGEEWIKSITEGINNSYAFVSLLSPDANESTWVRREFLWAEYRKKPIFPVWVRDCEIPIYVIERQVINAHRNYDAGLRELLSVLPAPRILNEEAEERTKEAFASPEPVEEILRGAEPEPIEESVPKKNRRALELEYLDRLRFEEFNADQYTALGGEAQVTTHGELADFKPFLMRQEFEHTPWSRMEQRETRRFEDAVSEILAIRRVVVLGEPGAGKSSTLWVLAKRLFEAALQNPQAPIPLLVRLGKWTDERQSLHDFIAAELGELGTYLDDLLREKRVALLLDGLNEMPAAQHKTKYPQVEAFIQSQPNLLAVVTCREQDYTIDLSFDRVVIRPLDPLRIREFVTRYLGGERGEALFWKLAGEQARVQEASFKQKFAERLPEWERLFWLHDALPAGVKWAYDFDPEGRYESGYWQNWRRLREQSSSLMQLARNPYMLSILTQVYVSQGGVLPDNRGELFRGFVEMLLVREHIIERDKVTRKAIMSDDARTLLHKIAIVAYEMQIRRVPHPPTPSPTQAGRGGDSSALTVLPIAEVRAILDERQLYLTGSTSILSIDDEVRFSHQLLQEYFAALYMRSQIEDGQLKASDIWKPDQWWERTNWEEAAILLAGLYSDDCTPVLDWIADTNPEVAAQCIVRSGAHTPDATKIRLRDRWLPRLTDLQRDPQPEARAAVGRALGMFRIGDDLADNRPGIGTHYSPTAKCHVPDIDWVEIPAGKFVYGDSDKKVYPNFAQPADRQTLTLPPYYISRYLITYAQFQAFIDAPDGFYNPLWWEGLATDEKHRVQPGQQSFKCWNNPRERVSWYDAIAFCRWLSDKLSQTVTLPTEQQYERAARWKDGRLFPWGNRFITGYANVDERSMNVGKHYLGQRSAVGIYPQGASVEGILDLIGNVWQWCLNEFDESDSFWHREHAARVWRGGSWFNNDVFARATYRISARPSTRNDDVGFRVVKLFSSVYHPSP
jgi:formylglycine-generating enzyme required for sulfatase activity